MKSIHLKAGRDKSLRRRHPWIFSGAIERVAGRPAAGDTVEVKSASGATLALAAWSPKSQIRARVWTFAPGQAVDAAFLRARVAAASSEQNHASSMAIAPFGWSSRCGCQITSRVRCWM